MQRMRENSQTMMRPGMMNANQYAMRANMRNGMVNGGAMPAEMAKRMSVKIHVLSAPDRD